MQTYDVLLRQNPDVAKLAAALLKMKAERHHAKITATMTDGRITLYRVERVHKIND